MEIKAEELLYKLQQGEEQGWPNVMAVYGEEDYYRSKIAAVVPEYVFKGVDPADRDITVFEKDTDLRQLAAVINTYPFFCGKSLVLLKDDKIWTRQESESKKQQLDKLAEILGDVPDYCTVFISAPKLDKRTKLFKQLKKQGLVCECLSIKSYELGTWLEEQASKYDARWERDAIGVVLEYLAPVEKAPLQLLQQEIAKLAVYAGERKTWTKNDVEEIFAALPEVSGFAITNSLADHDLAETLLLLAVERKKGTNILPVCALIMFKLRQMLQFMELRRQGYDQKGIAAELKLHPYVARKMQGQCRQFTEETLQQALLAISAMNTDIRKGGRDYARLEEIMVLLLGNK
ncbi:DNA polymerase III subunit delta [Phascolarctobacterium sp.]|uniref:DNA polymerase III subunit delta n=1 Tax=Phascolarctobacterium sp. TaxID=2049039 RepID=UPI00386ECC89